MLSKNPLPISFYQRNTVIVAQELLGCLLMRRYNNQILGGIITETEAYCGEHDPASHAYRGKTARNKAMFGPVGHSYVYISYGIHHCLNLVAKDNTIRAGGVLIRGLEPLYGIEIMQQNRGINNKNKLTNGPGKIGQALQLSLNNNHLDVTQSGELYVLEGIHIPAQQIEATSRIGISKAQDKLWRFCIKRFMKTFQEIVL